MEPNLRRAICRPDGTQDWEARKAQIVELYDGMNLDGLMKLMEEEHLFKATKKQYKTQLSRWELRKNTTAAEYKAMIRKERKRQRFGKARSAFRLRGAEVKDSNIIRFQKRKKIQDDDEMSDVATPSSLSCYTPTRDVRSRSPSLAHEIIPSSPTPEFNTLVPRIEKSLTLFPEIQRLLVSRSNWFPGFDEYINLSAVGAPTQSHKLLFSGSRGPLYLGTGSPSSHIVKINGLHGHLDCDIIGCSTVNDLQARRSMEQQQTQVFELQSLTNDAFDHVFKAIFGKSAFANTNNKTGISIPMHSPPCGEGLVRAKFSIELYLGLAFERDCKLELSFNSDRAALKLMLLFVKNVLGSVSRNLSARYTPERYSDDKLPKELTYAALSHRISNSDTNNLHARTPYVASSPASSYSRSGYQRAIPNFSGSSDPTLTEAATWNELMEVC